MMTPDQPERGGHAHGNYNPHSGDPKAPANPGLLDAMRAVALNDTPEARRALYRELSTATFLLPQPEPPEGEAPGLSWYKEGQPFAALAERDLQGRLVIPVFTDTTALFAWAPPEASYMAMPALTLFALMPELRADIIVINVAGPTGGEVTPGEARVLAQGGVPGPDGSYSFPQGGQLLVRYPDPVPPEGLVSALWRAAAAEPAIEAIYLVNAVFGEGEDHLLAGIEFSPLPAPGDLPGIMRQLSDALSGWVDEGSYVDFIVLLPGEPVEAEVKSRGMRIYARLFAQE